MDLVHAAFEPAGDGPHPTVLAMHGWGSNALDLTGIAPYIARGRCLMLCPQGPVEVEIGAINGYGWYQLRRGAPPDMEAMGRAADRLMRFVDGPHPTVLAMHGWGSNALDLTGIAPYIARGRCLMLCPQGPVEVEIGAINGYGWYQLRRGAPPDMEAMGRAADRLMRFVDSALGRYPIDRRKLIVMGFSQGGVMAYNLAIRHPERFAALVALSTWFPEELVEYAGNRDALAQLPTLIQHGRADEMIDIAKARESVEHLRSFKLPLIYREYDCGHEITADGIQDLYS